MTAAVIPLSLLFAFVCMYLSGIPANLLSLGALDFGIIVDGTLVMVVHVVRTLSERRAACPDADAKEAVREATWQMVRPVFVSLIIIIVAYLPLFLLERVERRLFTPMAFTVCYALTGSLLLTMTFVPVMATRLCSRSGRLRENPLLAWLVPRYVRVLRIALAHSGLVIAATIVVVAVALGLGSRVGREFLPQLDEGVVWIRATLPPGVAIEKSAEIASRMRDLIRRAPEVRLVSSQTGRQDSNTEPFGPNRTELLVALHPYDSWPRPRSKAAFVEELAEALRANFPGAAFSFTQPIIDMVTEAVTGSSADLAIIFTGPDLGELRRLAGRALAVVRTVPGAADTAIEQDADQPQLQIRVDRASVARYGLNVADVQEVIELAVGGEAVGVLFDGDRRFDVTVRYAAGDRASIDDIRNLLVAAPGGARIPLSQLAQISIADGVSIVTRRENRRQVSVRTNIRGRDQGGFAAEAQSRLAREVPLPPGYRVEWGGQFENLARASRRLLVTLPLTLVVIFVLLYLAFASTIDAGLVLLNVPFSMVGGVIALLIRGIPLSVSAAVGFVSVFGVAIMTGVLFIAEVNRRRSETAVTVEDAVIGAARARLTPNSLLILVALLGMVPAALASGIGSDIQRPMATVIVGGLTSTLLLTLIAMPSLYLLASRRRPPSKAMLPAH